MTFLDWLVLTTTSFALGATASWYFTRKAYYRIVQHAAMRGFEEGVNSAVNQQRLMEALQGRRAGVAIAPEIIH